LSTPLAPSDTVGPASFDNLEHEHAPVRHQPEAVSLGSKITMIIAVILPFAGLVAGIALMWGRGSSLFYIALMASMYVITVLGITVGFHRLFTHRSFETSKFMTAVLAIMGSMAVEGPLLKWVAMHRRHHQHSDDHDDPHSPHFHGDGVIGTLKGLWHAHLGWMFLADPKDLPRYVADLRKERYLKIISDLFPFWVALGMAIPAVIAGLVTMSWMGALLGFLWGGLARVFIVHHVTWSINSVCHVWGQRPFESHDESRNNVIFGVLGLGEGWHNNHHAFPTSARHGLKWWQLDVSYIVIKCLQWVGLAWRVRTPTPDALAMKAAK
jgi:stearoyl-CoA desaturase (Delta-9 desaturase)